MRNLNLPAYQFRFRTDDRKTFVLDVFRKKYVPWTPEEEVRQRFARYLVTEKGYPGSLMMTEQSLKVNDLARRCDILVHKPAGRPAVLVECKAPSVGISKEVFDQVARYNLAFGVDYLMVTNGLKHYCCHLDRKEQKVRFLGSIPDYGSL